MYTINTKINNQLSIWLIFMFFFISIMIVVGGLTRLTDSGLSITKWQLFSGIFPPLNEKDWLIYFSLYKEIPDLGGGVTELQYYPTETVMEYDPSGEDNPQQYHYQDLFPTQGDSRPDYDNVHDSNWNVVSTISYNF